MSRQALCDLAFLILLAARVTGHIEAWSWWVIFAPLIASTVIKVLLVVVTATSRSRRLPGGAAAAAAPGPARAAAAPGGRGR